MKLRDIKKFQQGGKTGFSGKPANTEEFNYQSQFNPELYTQPFKMPEVQMPDIDKAELIKAEGHEGDKKRLIGELTQIEATITNKLKDNPLYMDTPEAKRLLARAQQIAVYGRNDIEREYTATKEFKDHVKKYESSNSNLIVDGRYVVMDGKGEISLVERTAKIDPKKQRILTNGEALRLRDQIPALRDYMQGVQSTIGNKVFRTNVLTALNDTGHIAGSTWTGQDIANVISASGITGFEHAQTYLSGGTDGRTNIPQLRNALAGFISTMSPEERMTLEDMTLNNIKGQLTGDKVKDDELIKEGMNSTLMFMLGSKVDHSATIDAETRKKKNTGRGGPDMELNAWTIALTGEGKPDMMTSGRFTIRGTDSTHGTSTDAKGNKTLLDTSLAGNDIVWEGADLPGSKEDISPELIQELKNMNVQESMVSFLPTNLGEDFGDDPEEQIFNMIEYGSVVKTIKTLRSKPSLDDKQKQLLKESEEKLIDLNDDYGITVSVEDVTLEPRVVVTGDVGFDNTVMWWNEDVSDLKGTSTFGPDSQPVQDYNAVAKDLGRKDDFSEVARITVTFPINLKGSLASRRVQQGHEVTVQDLNPIVQPTSGGTLNELDNANKNALDNANNTITY